MSLVVERPDPLPPDASRKQTISLKSSADGCTVNVDVYSPSGGGDEPLPLLLAPHAITWTAAEDYHGGLQGLMRKYHPGYYGLAEKHGTIIAMPHGHHHREELCSVAGPEQIADMAHLVDALAAYGYLVDKRRVYACGLSMGAQEALVLAGVYPDRIAAVVAFNPIVDLAAWHEELATSEVPEIREYDTAQRIANEVGGLPSEAAQAYAARSALNYVAGLARVPTLVFWTEQDLIVPRQITHHTMLLYRRVKEVNINSPFAEYNHTTIHGPLEFNQVTRWQLHEWCDYDLALRWLLCHRR
jgi:pimeloyl-ACP methyl ester carboxylesterase